uniref:WYL domain-containing protein n=1 Tax=Flavobacterium sp. TaxID=239 RepID=UPI004049508D
MNSQLKSALILLENVFLGNATYTRAKFKERLQKDDDKLKHSDTTISRLLLFIHDVFGIKLRFNRNGTIEIEDENPNDASKYQFIKSLLLFGKIKENDILINHHFSFSNENYFQNSELITDIYECIIQQNLVKINYRKFNHNRSIERILKPLLIKEYLGRWYLISKDQDNKHIVQGIDRIVSFEKLPKKFEPSFDTLRLYDNTIGVNYSGNVVHLIIWAEDYQMKLFETYPLHKSQTIIERDALGGTFSLDVVLNYELKQLLASFLLKIKIIEPEHLKKEMQETFIKMAENNN